MKKMRNRWLAVALAAAMAMGTFSLPVCAEETKSPVLGEAEIFEDESVLAPESDFEIVLPESESAEMELPTPETMGEETESIDESESIAETESGKETETEKIVETDKETEIETAEETEEELEANYGNTAKGFVYRLYKLVLGREPDKKGLNEWTNYLTSGQKTGAEVADGFIYSKELTARKLSDSAYVEMLYKTFLNRSSDSSGKKYWVTRLQKGMSRAYVYRGFANSTEFQGICGQYGIRSGEVVLTAPKDQNEGVTMFVYRCYEKFLGRKPDDGGLNDWCNRLLRGSENAKQVAYGFVMSNEFQGAGLSNTSYVKTMYLGLFDRTADSTGLKDWTEKLDNGNSRESVFYGFADSQEFRKLAESFGLDSTWASTPVNYKNSKYESLDYEMKHSYREHRTSSGQLYAKYTADYPYFYGDANGAVSINSAVEKIVKDDFAKNSQQSIDSEYATMPASYFPFYDTNSVQVSYNKNGYVSFVWSIDWWGGGVRSSSDKYGYIYDIETGKELKCSDVFRGTNSQIKQVIIDYALESIDVKGFKAVEDKAVSYFSVLLEEDGVRVYYRPYTMGKRLESFVPYSSGKCKLNIK